MKCVIPCAGESSRMSFVPKHLIQINGKPLILHVVDAWKDYVDSFIFVIRRSATYLWEYLPENSSIVFQDEPKGLSDAIMQAEKLIAGRFIINLGDCVFNGKFQDFDSLKLGVWETSNLDEINKSYLVSVKDGLINRVTEKPNLKSMPIKNLYCGMGVYFMDTRIFSYIRRASVRPGGGDFTYVLQEMIDAGEEIKPNYFQGQYLNVTRPQDIEDINDVLNLGVKI